MNDSIRCVIFDLDGVLVHTDRFHEDAWRTIAREEGIAFDPSWPLRLRGVDRMRSLQIILEGTGRDYSRAEKQALADRKNELYRRAIEAMSAGDLADGARDLLHQLRARGIRIAVASSSRNAPALIDRLGLRPLIDAMADGNDDVPAKPEPALFLLAARRANVPPELCVVVEDAEAGVEAAGRAGMRCIRLSPERSIEGADAVAASIEELRALLLPEPRRPGI